MRFDPASFMANLFLDYHKTKWFLQTNKRGLEKAPAFLQMNYAPSMMMNLRIITMTFTLMNWKSKRKKNILIKSCLNLSVEAHDKTFTTNLFDKRDAFQFYNNKNNSIVTILLGSWILNLGSWIIKVRVFFGKKH